MVEPMDREEANQALRDEAPNVWFCPSTDKDRQPVPGMLAVQLLKDVRLAIYNKTIHAGMYFMENADGSRPDVSQTLHKMEVKEFLFDNEDAEELEEGVFIVHGDSGIKLDITPIEVECEGIEPHRLNQSEVLVWSCIHKFEEESEEKAISFFLAHYQPDPEKSVTEIKDGEITLHAKPDIVKAKTIGAVLGTMPINHSFVIKKAAQGITELPWTEQGTLKMVSRGNPNLRIHLKGNPESVTEYLAHPNANADYLARIWETARALAADESKHEMTQGNTVYVSTRTILRELTRTSEGINNEAAKKDSKFHALVRDGLKAWSSTQIAVYDDKGNLNFLDYALKASYREKIKDAQGNEIRDVWAFDKKISANQLWALEEVAIASRNVPLMEGVALNRKNAWIPHMLEGDIISEIRGCLYPKRGKGVREHTAKRRWFPNGNEDPNAPKSIFERAEPRTGGDITRKVQQRIIRDIQEQLEALAKSEAKDERPIYLTATSSRDGRKLGMLEVTGSKTYRKPSFDIS